MGRDWHFVLSFDCAVLFHRIFLAMLVCGWIEFSLPHPFNRILLLSLAFFSAMIIFVDLLLLQTAESNKDIFTPDITVFSQCSNF